MALELLPVQPLCVPTLAGMVPSPQSMEYAAHAGYSICAETAKGFPPTAGVTERMAHTVEGVGPVTLIDTWDTEALVVLR